MAKDKKRSPTKKFLDRIVFVVIVVVTLIVALSWNTYAQAAILERVGNDEQGKLTYALILTIIFIVLIGISAFFYGSMGK